MPPRRRKRTAQNSPSGAENRNSPSTPDSREGVTKEPQASDNDFRGRPFHDTVHKEAHTSPLSTNQTQSLDLRGILNLHVIIVCAQNSRLMIENLLKYGVKVRPIPPKSVPDLIENWPILLSLILIHIAMYGSFALEKWVIPWILKGSGKAQSRLTIVIVGLWTSTVLVIPHITINAYDPHPVAATILLAAAITWILKLVSFHHVIADVRRGLCENVDFADFNNNHTEAALGRQYPDSLTCLHFFEFVWMPTLCFQFSYPRSPRIRWSLIARHTVELVACSVMVKILVEQYMEIILENTIYSLEDIKGLPFARVLMHILERLLKLSVPNLYVWILCFIALFHCYLNILGELTRFADRQFYLDWWNAAGFGEYWRKWNLPIHYFLTRHVYKPLLKRRVNRFLSTIAVFFISALMHEYMIILPLQVGWIGLAFVAFMAQVPLSSVTAWPVFQKHPVAGNCLFWVLFCFTGQPAAIIIYYYLWTAKHKSAAAQ